MFTLDINGRQILTDENFSVVAEYENPVCNFTELNGPRGLGVEITNNEYTRFEFGHPERFEKFTTTDDRSFKNVSLRYSGFEIISGTLIINSADEEKYSGWIQSDLGALGTDQREKKITEMAWKTTEFDNKTEYVPGEDEYATVPIYNPAFWDGKGRQITDPDNSQETITYLTNRFRELKKFVVNKLNPDGTTDDQGEVCVISPFLFLNYAVTDMLKINSFYIDPENNSLTDQYLVNLLIYNNFNIFAQLFTTSLQDLTYFDQTTNEDVVIGTQVVTDMSFTLSSFSYADLLPKIPLKDFIMSLQNFLNVAFIFLNDRTVRIINRNTTIQKVPYDLNKYLTGQFITDTAKNVTLKFIQKLDDGDELTSDNHDLSDRRADFRDPVGTFAELQSIENPAFGELRYVVADNKIYEYKWHVFVEKDRYYQEDQVDILEWIFVSTGPQPFFWGDSAEVEKIETGISKLDSKMQTMFEGNMLQTKQQGNLASARSLYSDFSFRLMYYDRTALTQNILNFEQIFNLRWRDFADFWISRVPGRCKFDLPVNELYYVINQIYEPYRVRQGAFIISKFRIEFKGSQMGACEMEVYKL